MVHSAQFLSTALIFTAQRSNLFISKWWLISTRFRGVTRMHRFFTDENFSKERTGMTYYLAQSVTKVPPLTGRTLNRIFWSFNKHCYYHGSHPCLVFMVSLFLTVCSGRLIFSFLCEREQIVSVDSVLLAGLQMCWSKVLIERLTASLYCS